jgi:hypothetical protein
MGQHAPGGTKERVSACRKRLRRGRAMQKALKLAQGGASPAIQEALKAVPVHATFADSENIFEEVGAAPSGAARRFTAEVDRRARLRAR